MRGYEILEHTADVGIRATGPTLEACFEEATRALADIIGILSPGRGRPQRVEVTAPDLGALLVDWLGEILYLHDARDAVITDVVVDSVADGRAAGAVSLSARESPAEGTQVKAITWHRLDVRETAEGFVAEVYVDV